MKKTVLVAILSLIVICFASCSEKHTQAYNDSKAVLDKVSEALTQATNCDDVDAAAFGIIALLGVEGAEEMPEAEQNELTKLMEDLSTAMEAKKAEFGCQDEVEEEEVPFDEPVEEEMEEAEVAE